MKQQNNTSTLKPPMLTATPLANDYWLIKDSDREIGTINYKYSTHITGWELFRNGRRLLMPSGAFKSIEEAMLHLSEMDKVSA